MTKDALIFTCLHLVMNELYQQHITEISSTSFQSLPLFGMKTFHSHMNVTVNISVKCLVSFFVTLSSPNSLVNKFDT